MKLGNYELDNIYNEDCYEAIKKIPDKSIDLIYTDIPYLIGSGGKEEKKTQLAQRIKNHIYGTLSDIINGIDYSIFDEMCRVMKYIYIYIYGAVKTKY